MFSIQLLRRRELGDEFADVETRFLHGVWAVEEVDIDGTPHVLVFRGRDRPVRG